MEKLYLVTRADIPAGDQATQAAHALSAFACAYPELHRGWHEGGRNLVLLEARDEAALLELFARASEQEHPRAAFHEPDIGGELTAIALGGGARKLLSQLPLLLRAPRAA